jgi:hypothetical protein
VCGAHACCSAIYVCLLITDLRCLGCMCTGWWALAESEHVDLQLFCVCACCLLCRVGDVKSCQATLLGKAAAMSGLKPEEVRQIIHPYD